MTIGDTNITHNSVTTTNVTATTNITTPQITLGDTTNNTVITYNNTDGRISYTKGGDTYKVANTEDIGWNAFVQKKATTAAAEAGTVDIDHKNFTFVEGNNVTITPDKDKNQITISAETDLSGVQMQFAGDDAKNDATKVITKKNGERLDVVGGADDKASKDNIYTENKDGQIHINLAKDIEGVENITVNNEVKVGGNTVINGDTITTTNITGETVNTKTINLGDDNSKTTITYEGDRIKYGDNITVATLDDGMKYGGDIGKEISKKLGEQVNVVGGITDESKLTAEDNIGVVSDEKDNLKVRLAKDINLGDEGSVTIGGTKVTNNNITVGDTVITNDSVTTTDVNATNITATKTFKAGDVFEVTENGDVTYNRTDYSKAGDTTVVNKKYADSLGWNLQENGTQKDKVVNEDTVNFVNGDGTKVTIETADGKTSAVRVDLDKDLISQFTSIATDNRNVGLYRNEEGKQTIVSPFLEMEGVEDASAAKEVVEKYEALEAKKQQLEADGEDTTEVEAQLSALEADYAKAKDLAVTFAQATGTGSIALGKSSQAAAADSIALGTASQATAVNAVAIGREAKVAKGAENSVAIGEKSEAYGINSTAFGLQSTAYGEGSMAFGHGVVAGDSKTPDAKQVDELHNNPYVDYDLDGAETTFTDDQGVEHTVKIDPDNVIGAIAFGSYAEATGRGSLSVGRYSKAQSAYSTALGIRATVGEDANNAIAIGREVKVGDGAENSVAIGKGSEVTGTDSIAIGTGHQVGGNNSGAIGDPNVVNADNSYTVGNNSTIEKGADDSFVFGNNRIVKGKGSVVAGSATEDTTTEAANSVVIGYDANVELADYESVALGSGAIADRLGGYASPAANDVTVGNLTFSSSAGSDVAGTVSVGSAGRTRTLTYVGAGEISATSTDAINGSQLYSAIEAMQFDIVAGDNVEVVKDKQNGKTVYTIHSLNAIVDEGPSGNVTVEPKTGEGGTTNGKTTDLTGGGTAGTTGGTAGTGSEGTTTPATGGTTSPTASTEPITPKGDNNHTTTYTVDAKNTTYNMTSEQTTNEEDGSTTTTITLTPSEGDAQNVTITDTNTTYKMTSETTEDKGEGTTTTITLKPSDGDEQTVTFTDTNTHTSVVDDGKGYVTVESTKDATAEAGPEYKVSLDVDKLKQDLGEDTRNTVKEGDRIRIAEKENRDGSTEYTINGADVIEGDNMKVTYDEDANEFTVATKSDVKFDNVEVTNEFKAGDTTINNDGITIKNGGPDGDIVINKNKVDMGGNRITNVAPGEDGTDAVNVDQLNAAMNQTGDVINRLGDQISKVDNRMKKGLAGAAALAALHPLEFDPDDKLTFAAGLGNYRGQNAAAVGAFYRPDEKVMFSVGGTVGNGENMVNAGISFSLDRVPHVTNTKAAMAREILDLRREVLELKASMASGNWMLDPTLTRLFPDTEENHWAYEYVKTLAGNHIIEGYPDGEFKGDQMITRYEMAAILYRAMMNGAKLPDKALNEFADELGRFRVDRIYGNGDDRHKVERIRVNDENRNDRDVYGSRYEYFKQHPGANISTGALPGTDRAERAAKAEAAAKQDAKPSVVSHSEKAAG